MFKKIFWENPYQHELTARITAVDGHCVQVDSSIFFAECGGQESDEGTIGGISVVSADNVGTDIVYKLGETPPWIVGDEVVMRINPERRYRLMRLHFSAELVLEIIMQTFADKSIEKIGAHIGEHKARIDFIFPVNIAQVFPEIEKQVNQLIEADLPIVVGFDDEEQGRRFWQIEGFARVPCGGTHPRTTAEIGGVHFKRKNLGKNKERIEIYLDQPNEDY